MSFRTGYAIRVLAAMMVVCVACCLATSSDCDDCKYGYCLGGQCRCSLNCELYNQTRDYCLNRFKKRTDVCRSASRACGAMPHQVFIVRPIEGKAKHCKDEANGRKGEPLEFCHDQSYCSNGAGICLYVKPYSSNNSHREHGKTCLCDANHQGYRCQRQVGPSRSGKGGTAWGSAVIGVALLAVALSSLLLVAGVLVARKCRRWRAPRREPSRDMLEAVSLSSSASSTTVTDPAAAAGLSSNRSSQMLGECSPLWK